MARDDCITKDMNKSNQLSRYSHGKACCPFIIFGFRVNFSKFTDPKHVEDRDNRDEKRLIREIATWANPE